jgi:histone-lysine N-methyltransferase SETD8
VIIPDSREGSLKSTAVVSNSGLKVEYFVEKGLGIVACGNFEKGQFVVEYVGELIDAAEAKSRKANYESSSRKSCFMFYFSHGDKMHCIDATTESNLLGRLVNHSIRNANCSAKLAVIDTIPHIFLKAKRDILAGEELLYDYGERREEEFEMLDPLG